MTPAAWQKGRIVRRTLTLGDDAKLVQTLEAFDATGSEAWSVSMRHLTKRALEWLRAHRSGQKRTPYVSPPGVSACGVRSEDWCRTEDVRAIMAGEHHAVVWNGPRRTFRRRVLMPTCPKCAVLLDEALENAEAAP